MTRSDHTDRQKTTKEDENGGFGNNKEESAADESAIKSFYHFIPVVERPGKISKKSLSEEVVLG
jgi:hypothetical protein